MFLPFHRRYLLINHVSQQAKSMVAQFFFKSNFWTQQILSVCSHKNLSFDTQEHKKSSHSRWEGWGMWGCEMVRVCVCMSVGV